jgi:hypothetical protein
VLASTKLLVLLYCSYKYHRFLYFYLLSSNDWWATGDFYFHYLALQFTAAATDNHHRSFWADEFKTTG